MSRRKGGFEDLAAVAYELLNLVEKADAAYPEARALAPGYRKRIDELIGRARHDGAFEHDQGDIQGHGTGNTMERN